MVPCRCALRKDGSKPNQPEQSRSPGGVASWLCASKDFLEMMPPHVCRNTHFIANTFSFCPRGKNSGDINLPDKAASCKKGGRDEKQLLRLCCIVPDQRPPKVSMEDSKYGLVQLHTMYCIAVLVCTLHMYICTICRHVLYSGFEAEAGRGKERVTGARFAPATPVTL